MITRFAFKAQSPCRATLETLAVIKHPPVFARQANIANGPQQVNNQMTVEATAVPRVRADAAETAPSKLLENLVNGLTWGAQSKTGEGDHGLATVGVVNGTAKR